MGLYVTSQDCQHKKHNSGGWHHQTMSWYPYIAKQQKGNSNIPISLPFPVCVVQCSVTSLQPGTLEGLTQSDLSVSLCISCQQAGRRGQRWWRLGPSRSGPQQRTSACGIRESEEGMTVRHQL